MKKLSFIISALLIINANVAQTKTVVPDSYRSNDVIDPQTPNLVTNRFNSDYPNTNPTWIREGSNYRADYFTGTTEHSVTYDVNGKMLSREDQLPSGPYPSAINDYYARKYPNELFVVWSNTDAKGNQTYYTYRNTETFWFDKTGKFRKKSTTKPGETSQEPD